MIFRIWHGWTTPENAGAYERIVQDEVFEIIAGKKVAGYRSIDLLRREVGEEVEFVTIMRFESLDSVRAFAGDDYERAFVPPQAQAVLKRFEERSAHYDLVRHIDYQDWGQGR